jgi:hypothetical protein
VRVEVLYFDGCPHHDGLPEHITRLLAGHGVPAAVTLRRVDTDEDARRLAFLGSPTVRVNGDDVDPTAKDRHGYGLQCRLYPTPAGMRGTPPDDWIVDAATRH